MHFQISTFVSGLSLIVYKCCQYSVDNHRAPLLPPNQFRYIDSRTDIVVDDAKNARSLYQRYRQFHSNRYNRRKFVDGALYTSLFEQCADIIYPIAGVVIKLDVLLLNTKERTNVTIYYDDNIVHTELLAMTDMGEALSSYADNTRRCNNFDGGKMNVIGSGKKGDGTYGMYNLSNCTEDIKKATMGVTSIVKQYYEGIGLSKEVLEMNNHRLHGQMDNKKFFNSTIVQSQNLINAAHNDVDDKTISIATWTEKNVGTAAHWYFLLPNVTRNGSKGIAIKISNGVTIVWDGRTIFHCSTVGDIGKGNNVYGTYFGGKS